jgi:aubergine
VTAIVLILQGNKNGAPHYEGIKKLLMTERPVPSQVILSNTISRGKNLRSICNKILIQINAKIGGEPWALSDMPLMNKPCMIIGYDVFHKRGKHSQLALCATVSRTGTKYWSKSVEQI